MQSETGRLGEDLAAKFIEAKGYKILERNFRTQFGEIDIIAKKNGVLIFVEVKTLLRPDSFWATEGQAPSSDMGQGTRSEWEPELHFTSDKMRKMQRTIRAYLKDKRIIDIDYQLDLIAIELGQDNIVKDIRHYENITI
jgi:putative endonuclease